MSKIFNPWEVWFAKFPYEEDNSLSSGRPVIVLHADDESVLVIKVTCHSIRGADKFDTPLVHWKDAHLNRPSVARVSKTTKLAPDMLIARIGVLKNTDAFAVFNSYRTFITSMLVTSQQEK